MGALSVLLVVTNLAALAVIGRLLFRPAAAAPDARLAEAIDRVSGPAGSGTRRIITMEILNAVDLAASRNRMAGIAGALAPGLLRRVVIDQACKQMKRDLRAEGVV